MNGDHLTRVRFILEKKQLLGLRALRGVHQWKDLVQTANLLLLSPRTHGVHFAEGISSTITRPKKT